MTGNFEVYGFVAPGFESVKKVFEQNFINGTERKANLCVYQGDQVIVDLTGIF